MKTRDMESSSRGDTRSCTGAPQKLAVVIGINHYPHLKSDEQLLGAVPDAWNFYHYLVDPQGGGVPKENATLLLNGEATRGNIIGALGNLNACQDDTVYIYFAGHGVVEDKSMTSKNAGGNESVLNSFLLAYDSKLGRGQDGDSLVATGISMRQLPDFLSWRLENQGRLLLFVDACHSGAISFSQERGAKRVNVPTERQAKRVNQLNSSIKGLVGKHNKWGVITAAASNQTAKEGLQHDACPLNSEGEAYPGGIFTCHLLRGLTGFADHDHNTLISWSELHGYMTTELSHIRINQNPTVSGSLSGDEELFRWQPQETQIQVPELPQYLTLRYVEPAPNTVTTSLLWIGGLSLVAGAIFHGLSYGSAQDATNFQAARGTPIDYRDIQDSFELQRNASIASYGLSLVTTLSLSGIRWYERHKQGKAQKMKPIILRMSTPPPNTAQ